MCTFLTRFCAHMRKTVVRIKKQFAALQQNSCKIRRFFVAMHNKKEIYFGPYLLKENSNLFKEKNKQDLEKLEYLYKIIPKSHILHRIKIKNKINMYKKLNNA